MKTFFGIAVLAAIIGLSAIIFAADGGGRPAGIGQLKPLVESFESDCPACGWDLKEKRSDNKPAEGFDGVFEPGTKCPFCGGTGKLFDTVDWKSGVVTACGVTASAEKGEFAQEKLMAQRGAKVTALRNAAAAVMRLRLSPGKKMPKSYERKLSAFVDNFEVSKYVVAESGKKPAAMAIVTVPLWGVKSVCAEIYDSELKRFVDASGRGAAKDEVSESWTEETFIVIDMRSAEYQPNLFPQVVDDENAAVYDVSFVLRKNGMETGVARYVELGKDEKSFDDLKNGLETGSLILKRGEGLCASLVSAHPLVFAEGADSNDNSSGRSGQTKEAEPKKRTIVVKGTVKTDGKQTKAAVSSVDAKRMNDAEKTGGAKLRGNIIIITNAAGGK